MYILYSETQYEEVENTQVPASEAPFQSPRRRCLKTIEPILGTKEQKKIDENKNKSSKSAISRAQKTASEDKIKSN